MLVSFFANHAFIFRILIILERQRFFVSVYHVYSFLFFFFLKNYNSDGIRVRSLGPYVNVSRLRIFLREREKTFVSEIPILDTDI